MLTRADQTVTDCARGARRYPSDRPSPHRLQGRRRPAGDAARAGRADPRSRRDVGHGGRVDIGRSRARIEAGRARHRRPAPLGGTQDDEVLSILAGSATTYHPFPANPVGHPTKLGGSPAEVEAHRRASAAKGCAGVDLLALPRDRSRSTRARARGEARHAAVTLPSPASVATPAQIAGAARRQRRRVHDRLRRLRRLVLAAPRIAAVAAEGDPRCH